MRRYISMASLVIIFSLLTIINVSGEPVINIISPEDGAKLDINPTLMINVTNDHPMDIIWYFNESGQWKTIGVNSSVKSGIYTQIIPNGTEEGVNYQWGVNISDDTGYLNKTYWFRRIGWQKVSWHSFSFGGYLNVTGKIFPPPEGNGIFYFNESSIKSSNPESVLFSLDLVTTPKTGRIFELGEYLVEGERIVAVIFDTREFSEYIGFNEVILDFISSDDNIVSSQKLDLSDTITELEFPVYIDSSGLWKLKLNFNLNNESRDFQVWEKLTKEYAINDRDCLTFNLTDDLALSFQNYYERVLPVFTLSEVINFHQMLLAEKQGKYLNDTSTFLKNTAETVSKMQEGELPYIIISIFGAGILGFLASIGVVIYKEKREKNGLRQQLSNGLRDELGLNLEVAKSRLNDMKMYGLKTWYEWEKRRHSQGSLPFYNENYLSLIHSGELLNVFPVLHTKIRRVYSYMRDFEYYTDFPGPGTITETIIDLIEDIVNQSNN